MALFDIPERKVINEKDLVNKLNPVKKSLPKMKLGKDSLLTSITNIKNVVENRLGKYKDDYLLLKEEDKIIEYFDKILENKVLSIDLETNGLSIYDNHIVGLCLYTPNMKPCYIPIRHISYLTGDFSASNVDVTFITSQLKRLENKQIYTIYHNAKFDYKFMLYDFKVDLEISYDTMIAAKLINNLEPASLKYQHAKYIEDTSEFSTFGDLFQGISFDYIPANIGYLYGAKDALMTYELMNKQLEAFKDLERVKWVFDNIEMPLVKAVAETEMNGIEIDFNLADELIAKHQIELDNAEKECYEELDKYKIEIDSYNMKNRNSKLSSPINLASPTQLAILLYDILKLPSPSKKSPRGTDEEALIKINSKFTQKLLEVRRLNKLMNTYLVKLPKEATKDGRIHASFNQIGTDTGRFSSSSPNMQNVPSSNRVREIFKAKDGYVLIGSDWSQQEPRLLAEIAQDKGLLFSYKEDKDVYAYIAAIAFKRPYDECKEFRPDGTKNPEGKKYRNQAKAVALGLMYSKGVDAVANDLGITKQEAENVFNSFFKAFPSVENFIKTTQASVRKKGYTETFFGRRRQIPDMLLEPYVVKGNKINENYDPTDFDNEIVISELSKQEKQKYIDGYKKSYGFIAKQNYLANIKSNYDVEIIDNSKKVQDAERQCVNAIIQGTAADQAKLAIIKMHQNKELKELGFKLLLYVHDEIIGECPQENAKRCGELMSEIMSKCVEDYMKVPFKCDIEFTKCWYGDLLNLDKI